MHTYQQVPPATGTRGPTPITAWTTAVGRMRRSARLSPADDQFLSDCVRDEPRRYPGKGFVRLCEIAVRCGDLRDALALADELRAFVLYHHPRARALSLAAHIRDETEVNGPCDLAIVRYFEDRSPSALEEIEERHREQALASTLLADAAAATLAQQQSRRLTLSHGARA